MTSNSQSIVEINRIDPLLAAKNQIQYLGEQEQRCAELLLREPNLIIKSSIADFAKQAKTSQATVVRFAKKLGFAGYPHLKLALVASLGFQVGSNAQNAEELELGIKPNDLLGTMIEKLMNTTISTVRMTRNLVSHEVINELVESITRAKVVGTYGAGASNLVAKDCQLKFARLGKTSVHFHDNHQALSSIGMFSGGDVLILVSHTGKTAELITVLREFKARNIKVATITNDAHSILAKQSDFVLLTQAERKTIRIGATVSRVAQLFMVDCLTLAWAQRSWTSSKSASEAASDAVMRSNNLAPLMKTENWPNRGSIPERVRRSSTSRGKNER
jgi:DNA-binding MurR/RpiR family transcriptional regulator